MDIQSVKDHEHSSIHFKQWVSTDRCQMIEVSEEFEMFIDSLCSKVHQLTHHHFIAKCQSAYLKELKTSLNDEELIILADFSENYSYGSGCSSGISLGQGPVHLTPLCCIFQKQQGCRNRAQVILLPLICYKS